MDYEDLSVSATILYWTSVAAIWLATGFALLGFRYTAIFLTVIAVAGGVWSLVMFRQLRRRIRVHNLTIVTVKLDAAIAELDR